MFLTKGSEAEVLVEDGIIAEPEDVVADGPGRGRTELGCRLLWTVDEEKKEEGIRGGGGEWRHGGGSEGGRGRGNFGEYETVVADNSSKEQSALELSLLKERYRRTYLLICEWFQGCLKGRA